MTCVEVKVEKIDSLKITDINGCLADDLRRIALDTDRIVDGCAK